MLSKRYESTEVGRRTWLHVPSGTHWSTSSDTHQVVEIQIETSTKILKAKIGSKPSEVKAAVSSDRFLLLTYGILMPSTSQDAIDLSSLPTD